MNYSIEMRKINSNNLLNYKINFKTIYLIFLFVILPLIYETTFSDYIIIGFILLSLLMLVIKLFNSKISQIFDYENNKYIYIFFIAFIIWQLFSLMLYNINFDSIIRIIQTSGCLFVFLFAITHKIYLADIAFLKNIITFIIYICFFVWIFDGMPLRNFSFFYDNANTFCTILIVWTSILLLDCNNSKFNLFYFIGIIFTLLFSIVSSSRIAMLLVLMFILMSFFLKKSYLKKHFKRNMLTLFIIEFAILSIFTTLYSGLRNTEIGLRLQEISYSYFGKQFFSGRDRVWGLILDKICEKPIFGYGLDALPSQFILDIRISSHNSFLQIALQSGFVGMFFIIFIIISILIRTLKYKSINSVVFYVFIMIIVFHEFFEISLTQNMLVGGLGMWFIMGLGCNKYFNQKKVSNLNE